MVGGRRIERFSRIPEGAHRLHLAGEVPDVGRNGTSRASNTDRLEESCARVGHEIESETRDNQVGAVAWQRYGLGAGYDEARTNIRNQGAGQGQKLAGGIDADNRLRLGGFENGLGEGTGATTDINPVFIRGSGEPGEELVRDRAT